MKKLLAILALALLLISCSGVKQKTKDTINSSGEVVGKSATEFVEGITEGVNRSLDCDIILSQALKDKGLRTGKFSIGNDTTGGTNNLLTLYLIFDKDFKNAITLKTFDKKGLENGRIKVNIEGKAGEAKFYDFHFDKRTCIEVKSKINIE